MSARFSCAHGNSDKRLYKLMELILSYAYAMVSHIRAKIDQQGNFAPQKIHSMQYAIKHNNTTCTLNAKCMTI